MWNSNEIVRVVMVHLSSKTAVCVLGFVAGAGSTYLTLNKTLKTKYENLSEQEIDEARRFYKRGDYSDPVKALEHFKAEEAERETAAEIINNRGYAQNEFTPAPHVTAPVATEEELLLEDEPKVEVHVQNVFVNNEPFDEDFDYEEEMKNRSEDYPYVISHDEFIANDVENSQNKLTYFQDDDFLLDDEDSVIEDSDYLVGDKNLERFGHGSKDNNVVYIRNERLEIDFEIVRAQGSYVKSMLGVDEASLEHSDYRRPRKMRSADE